VRGDAEDEDHVEEGPDEEGLAVLYRDGGNGAPEATQAGAVVLGGAGDVLVAASTREVSEVKGGDTEDSMVDEGEGESELWEDALPDTMVVRGAADGEADRERPMMEEGQVAQIKGLGDLGGFRGCKRG
jgi:hypothetical protein